MSTLATQFAIVVTLLLVLLIKIEGDHSVSIPNDENSINIMVEEVDVNEESPDCSTRPWICSTGTFPPKSICCGNRCVDIANDRNNCGMCGVNCPLNWQCCNRLCVNINLSPLNCGGCGRICPIGRLCRYGMCATNFAYPSPPPPPLLPPMK
ncbi:stigma-specific STIG1-like protein 4 [Vicia villosa]|uniref:stigma-specific STIG1-like protein 4 n=1 Tax=Vicia villosa TaxID=3911 RepID=UPI00273ADBEE|nr:stigma-specific STIG1-like protein 4 [Vicia villosa]